MIQHPLRFAALAVALVTLGAVLVAKERGHDQACAGFGAGPGFHHGGLRGLKLSEAQKTQFKALHERHQKTLEAKAEAARNAGKALHEALAKDADEKTLRTLHDQVAAAQFDLLLEHRALRQEILPLLTPEQKVKFAQMPMGPGAPGMGGPGMGMGPHMGRGPGMGPGMDHEGHGHPGPGQPPPAEKPSN